MFVAINKFGEKRRKKAFLIDGKFYVSTREGDKEISLKTHEILRVDLNE